MAGKYHGKKGNIRKLLGPSAGPCGSSKKQQRQWLDRQTDRKDLHFPQSRQKPGILTASGTGSQDIRDSKWGHCEPLTLVHVGITHTRITAHVKEETPSSSTHTHTPACKRIWYPLGDDGTIPQERKEGCACWRRCLEASAEA